MFDHLGIVVQNIDASKNLYMNVLATLGIELLQDNTDADTGWLVFGTSVGEPFFVVSAGKPTFWKEGHQTSQSPIHCAFSASSKSAVEEFHAQGLRFGAHDNGGPGDRGRSYYAAYLIDLDGNNIEAGYRELAS